jgi:LysM repeat protein
MEWRERQEDEAAGTGAGMDVEAPGYSVLRQNSWDSLAGRLGSRFLVLAAALVLGILVILGIWRLLGSADGVGATDLARVEADLAGIQQRLEVIETRPGPAMDLEAIQIKVDRLLQRLDRSEAALSERIASLEQQLKARPPAPAPGPPPAPAAPAPKTVAPAAPAKTPPPAKPAPAKAEARVYTVKPGDTLYSISRSAGISVDVLRRINQLGADATIHPGDRLKVTP